MTSRCQFCANLSIAHLVELAKQEFKSGVFPETAYYKHHESFTDLAQSAKAGCDLCQLICECFKAAPWDEYMRVGARQGVGSVDIDNSMYARAEGLQISEVKIAIDSSETWVSQELDEVRVFDTLMVQVGLDCEQTGPDNDPEHWVPVLPLVLTVPRDKVEHIDGFQIGRFQVESSLASPVNFDIARGWLDECLSRHPDCLSSELPQLPTRVIDVGIGTSSETTRIIHSRGLTGHYVALSHCWGGNINMKLAAKTLDSFQVALPYKQLPANFRDAITITRELGIQYLWIDSLCILQDSAKDWEDESRKMGRVYGDSALTISAVASKASTVGILVPSSEPAHAPAPLLSLPIYPSDDTQSSKVQVQVEVRDLEEEDLYGLHANGPLNRRGWCLQESILSPRVLSYGSRQIYWKCPKQNSSADGLARHRKGPPDLFRDISRELHSERLLSPAPSHPPTTTNNPIPIPPTETTEALLTDYYSLVQEYSSRQLSFPSDKLPAFSGLARRLGPLLAGGTGTGTYLAGLWLSDWRRGLLWYTEGRFCLHHRSPYRAPSWSWAVTDGPVVFASMGEVAPWGQNPALGGRLVGCQIMPWRAEDPFGRIESGWVMVEGLTVRLVRSRQRAVLLGAPSVLHFDEPEREGDEDDWGPQAVLPLRREEEGEEGGGDSEGVMVAVPHENGLDGVKYDEFEIDEGALSEREYRLLVVQADEEEGSLEEEGRAATARCLVIQPLKRRDEGDEAEETWERVGLGFIDVKFNMVKLWERREFTLY